MLRALKMRLFASYKRRGHLLYELQQQSSAGQFLAMLAASNISLTDATSCIHLYLFWSDFLLALDWAEELDEELPSTIDEAITLLAHWHLQVMSNTT